MSIYYIHQIAALGESQAGVGCTGRQSMVLAMLVTTLITTRLLIRSAWADEDKGARMERPRAKRAASTWTGIPAGSNGQIKATRE